MNASIRAAVVFLGSLLALAGCTQAPAPRDARAVVFRCPDHAPIRVVFAGATATLHAGGAAVVMAQQHSGDGFRYAGGGQSLRGKGGGLDWTDASGTLHRCQARDWPPG